MLLKKLISLAIWPLTSVSLTGAIAGIADQPIRGFQRAGNAGEGYRGDQAREVISGLGKGLVGAVVKPIGGAAELVSQTGQGIASLLFVHVVATMFSLDIYIT